MDMDKRSGQKKDSRIPHDPYVSDPQQNGIHVLAQPGKQHTWTRAVQPEKTRRPQNKHTCECSAMPLPRSLFSGFSPMTSLVSLRSGVNGPNCGSNRKHNQEPPNQRKESHNQINTKKENMQVSP